MLEPDPVLALFTPVVIMVVIGTSIVLTFNQLVLTRELAPIGELREQMTEVLMFRENVEEVADLDVSPPEPSMFLRRLVEATGDYADELADAAEDVSDQEAREDVVAYANDIAEDAERVGSSLKGEQFGEFAVVQAALNYNYSWKIFDGRRLRNQHADALPDRGVEVLDDLLDALEFFGPAREHFKTMYFRLEIINVSRDLVYAALPALIVAAYMILVFQAEDVTGATLGFNNRLIFTAGAFLIGCIPFAVFLMYIIRIITISKLTFALGPFILRETERSADVE